ncbi:MAG: hypothetical protein HYX56_07265 [Chloroflexi bacterium]|nr:hypothetical protein [Chloroflexota bacterium]
MRVPALAPYAAAALLISVGSSIAAIQGAHPARPAATAAASVAPAAHRVVPELSRTGRLAFWRDGKLWVSDLSGATRYAIASVDDIRRVSLTRWSTEGGSVAFVDGGLSLAVIAVDGTRVDVDLPFDLRTARYRVADIRWSPSGRRVAATLLQQGSGNSDAFLVDLTAATPQWTRLTGLDDLFIGDWISEDEVLAYTATGVIGIVSTAGRDKVRLLGGSVGVSPIVGPEGRIHYLVGRLPTTRDPALPYVTANSASAWSAATDGSDVRRETTWAINDIRLDARLPDGRYLAHRGSSTQQGTVGEDIDPLPSTTGVIERVRVAPDGRVAYGFTRERIARIDLAKIGVPPPASPATALTVFLETGGEADIWFPTQLSLARGGERVPAALARSTFAFAFGGHTWKLEGGVTSLLRVAPQLRRTALPLPEWSPTGEHLAVVEQAGSALSSSTFIAVVLGRDGEATRLTSTLGAARSYSWAPGGRELAVVVDGRGLSGIAPDAQLEVRFLDLAGKATRPAVAGTEVAWTAKGILVLTAAGIQRVEEGRATTVFAREKLATISVTGIDPSLAQLDATPDGAFVSVRLAVLETAGSRAYLVISRGGDTAPLRAIRADALSDTAWSPVGTDLGYTLDIRTASERAVIETASGVTLATQEGRFAGWSADGRWYYVARVTGLFAYPIGGGAAARVGPVGVPITAAPSR